MVYKSSQKNSRRKLYIKGGTEPFRISRSKIDLFIECPRCFYLDQRLGISRPSGPAFTLNSAVDHLLKQEFDVHRAQGTGHPLFEKYGIDAVPFKHEKMEEWRDSFKRGISFFHSKTNLFVRGGVDDVWITPDKELLIIEYKSTSKDGEVQLEDTKWHNQYRRQLEIYQWLFRKNGFKVSDTAYFVYVNGKRDRKAFDGKLEFDVKLIPYKGNDSWIEKTLIMIKHCLENDRVPNPDSECQYCAYRQSAGEVLQTIQKDIQKEKKELKSQKLANKSGVLKQPTNGLQLFD